MLKTTIPYYQDHKIVFHQTETEEESLYKEYKTQFAVLFYDKNFGTPDSAPVPTVIKVLLPSTIISAFIGRGGARIKALRHDYKNTFINIATEDCPGSTERILTIAGKLKDVIYILNEVIKLILTTPLKKLPVVYNGAKDQSYKLGMKAYGGFEKSYIRNEKDKEGDSQRCEQNKQFCFLQGGTR